MPTEAKEHAKMRKEVHAVLQNCGFKSDMEVHLNLSGARDEHGHLTDERSFDTVAFVEYRNFKCLLIFECKSGSISGSNTYFAGWKHDIQEILKDPSKVTVLSSKEGVIKEAHFRSVEAINLAIVLDRPSNLDAVAEIASRFKFLVWDRTAIKYYLKITRILKSWCKYEIFREFGIKKEASTLHKEFAVRVKQGDQVMYVTALHPGLLLKIAYVARRTSTKPTAYQRLLNQDRLQKVTDFLKDRKSFLPNNAIIVFDNEPEVQANVSYNEATKELQFPVRYCSAWVIDGQHRVYGFIGTRHEEWSDENNDNYKLPVVIFQKLREEVQNRAFVEINYNQKKIDPTLLCDLATATGDLKVDVTWPSLLASRLNQDGVLKGLVKVSELDYGKPITLSTFVKYGLLVGLLGYNGRTRTYNGPLFNYAPFDRAKAFSNANNQQAFDKQLKLLKRFFKGVAAHTDNADPSMDPWKNTKSYSLLKSTGINALLLLLGQILKANPRAGLDLKAFLTPLRKVDFSNDAVSKMGGGWKGFRKLTNNMVYHINRHHGRGTLKRV